MGFVGLWAAAFDYRCLCAGVTHPQPLSRGEVWMILFYLEMSILSVVFPLLRGDKGVCYGERCGLV